MISSLFFLERKKSHYILFGVFAGLAQLTHPMSVTLIASYMIFLLIKKEIKGFFIMFCVWIAVLFPWLVRNMYIFSDMGKGLYIPFSTKFSELILNLFPNHNIATSNLDQANKIVFKDIGVFEMFSKTDRIFRDYFGSEYLLIFIIVFSSIVFFSWKGIKNRIWYFIFIILSMFVIYYYSFNFQAEETTVQILLVFIIPPIFLLIVYKTKRNLFAREISRFQIFIILYLFINVLGMYHFALTSEWQDIGLRFFFFQIFLFIPLAMFGFEKIIKKIFSRIAASKQEIVFCIIISLILIPVVFDLVKAQEQTKKYTWWFETAEMKEIHDIIKNNASSEKTIASNYPDITWYRTEMNSISLPNYIENQESFDEYIKYYDIPYLVFYKNIDNQYISKLVPESIMNMRSVNFGFEEQRIGESSIIKVKDLMGVNISNPFFYINKMQALEKLGKINDAKMIYNELRDVHSNYEIDIKICESFVLHNLYEDAIYKCEKLLEKNPANLIALHNLVNAYNNINQKENVIEVLNYYERLFEKSSSEELVRSWVKTIDYLILNDISYQQIIDDLLIKAKKLHEQGDSSKSLILLERLTQVKQIIPIDAFELKITILGEYLGKYDNTPIEFDSVLEQYKKESRIIKEIYQLDEVNDKEKIVINNMIERATFLVSSGESKKALKIYYGILSLDQFNPTVYRKIAEYYEEEGSLLVAIHNYELASQFDPENNYLIQKIEELKNKIE